MSCSRMAGRLAARARVRNHKLNRLGWMGEPSGMVKTKPLQDRPFPSAVPSKLVNLESAW